MAALRAILELFGSLDTAAEQLDEPAAREAVAALIPGDPDNTGWFAELDAFMFPGGDRTQPGRSSEPPRTNADFNLAMQDATDPARIADEPLTIPELARIIYGFAAATRMDYLFPGSVPGYEAANRGDGTTAESPVAAAFRLAAPVVVLPSGRALEPRISLDDVRTRIAQGLENQQAWYALAQQLSAENIIDPRIAHNIVEGTSVVSIKGIKSLVVDTQFDTNDATLNEVKAVVDPRNWHYNYPAFFCDMEGNGKRSDSWRRVLETVGAAFVPYSRKLRTNLKFFKSDLNDTAGAGEYWAHLDYDLNNPVPDPLGDGQIDVDRGYINMRATISQDGTIDPDKKGVTIRTRKVAHIKGIRPETQARFCLIFGYTAGALDMLIGPATDGRDLSKYYPWVDYDDRPRTPSKEPPSTNSVASTAFQMAVTCSEDLMVKNLDLADKWMSGELTLKDLADFSSEFGARLASDPWKFLQAVVPPSKGGGT